MYFVFKTHIKCIKIKNTKSELRSALTVCNKLQLEMPWFMVQCHSLRELKGYSKTVNVVIADFIDNIIIWHFYMETHCIIKNETIKNARKDRKQLGGGTTQINDFEKVCTFQMCFHGILRLLRTWRCYFLPLSHWKQMNELWLIKQQVNTNIWRPTREPVKSHF